MRIACTALLLALALSGCGRDPSTPTTVAPAAAPQEAISRIGDVTVRASVMQTSALSPAVAQQYGIPRDDRNVMLLVAVRQGPEAQEVALPATVTAHVTDLRGRRQTLTMRELRSGDLLDYVGTVEVSLPDTLRFDLEITRAGGATSTMQFSRDFYPR